MNWSRAIETGGGGPGGRGEGSRGLGSHEALGSSRSVEGLT